MGPKFDMAPDLSYRAVVLARAHGIAADKLAASHLWLGVPLVIITSIVGTSAFASLAELGSARIWIAIATGALSVSAAVLAGLQTFLNFSDRATKHATAAATLSALAGEPNVTNEQISEATKEAPRVSLKLQTRAQEEVDAELDKMEGRRRADPRSLQIIKRKH